MEIKPILERYFVNTDYLRGNMSVSIWLSLVLVCCIGAMSPGPSLAVVMRHTLNHSRLHGVVAGIAHALGVGFYALLSALGLALLITQSPTLFSVLTYVGAAYLAWMGFQMIRQSENTHLRTEVNPAQVSLWKAARDGSLIALLNPKLALYFIALFSQFITPSMTLGDKFIFTSTITIIDGAWYVLVAVVLSQHGILPWLRRHSMWIDRVMGMILILLALKVIL